MRSLQLFHTRSFRPIFSTGIRRLVSARTCFVALLLIALLMSIFISPTSSSLGREASRSSNAGKYVPPINGWLNSAGRAPEPDNNRRVRYVGAAPTASPTPPVGCCGGEEGNNKPHLLAGSYYTLKNNFSAKLLLNNKGPLPIEVQPTLYSLSGERFAIPSVTVDANAHRFVNLRDWAALAGKQFREGSMQLFHRGKDLVLGTQIYLTDEEQSLSFEEKLTELGKGSSRLEGVWWLPSPKGEVRLVLSNTTDAALSVSPKIQGESPKKDATATLHLGPHETRVLDVEADIMGRRHGAMSRFGAISVEHNGAPGAVLARAMALDVDEGFSLPVQFSNPAAAKSQNLQGAGLRIAKAGGEQLSAKVVVHNASQTEMTVTGRVPYAMKDGSTGELYLPQMQLSNGETQVIEVTQLLKSQGVRRNEVASAGLEFQHTGDFGSLITAAFSVSEGGNQVFRMPVWDVAAQRSATGGYPWYVEGDSSTQVYIKNATDQPRQFRMYIMYASGAYLYPLTTVAPRQTTTIDIRALRDHQVPDANGQTIPLTEKRGQLEWSMTGGEDRVLIGRSEQVDLAKGISSNYACLNCCGNSFYDGWVNPEGVNGVAGDQTQLQAFQRDANCYGQAYLPYTVGAGFNSFAPSICDSTFGGMTTGLGPGEAWIQSGWTADAWYVGLNEQCEYNPQQILRDALCEMADPGIFLKNAKLYELTSSFDGLSNVRTATLNAGSSVHGTEICGNNPQEFTIIVNFGLPPGGELVPARCKATPQGIPDQNYTVGIPTCVMDDSFEGFGHMSIPARRRCCGGDSDHHPGIRFVIGANKTGQTGTIDTPGTVRVLCNQ